MVHGRTQLKDRCKRAVQNHLKGLAEAGFGFLWGNFWLLVTLQLALAVSELDFLGFGTLRIIPEVNINERTTLNSRENVGRCMISPQEYANIWQKVVDDWAWRRSVGASDVPPRSSGKSTFKMRRPVRFSPSERILGPSAHLLLGTGERRRNPATQGHVPRGWNGPALPESCNRAMFRGGGTDHRCRNPATEPHFGEVARDGGPVVRSSGVGRTGLPRQHAHFSEDRQGKVDAP